MKQPSLPISKRRPLTERNVIHVAFGKFNPKCRPANIEIAMADPVFYGILKARARQLVKQADNNQGGNNEHL